MWSKKWYLKRNISCYVHLLNKLLETDVPWHDVIVVSAGKLMKLWDSLNELRVSVCERRLERTVLRPALLSVKTAQFTEFFRQLWRHTIKSLSWTESLQGAIWTLYYTQRRTTVGRMPMDEWSARGRDLYLTKHKKLKTDRHLCPPVGFEPKISADERSQTYALDRKSIVTGKSNSSTFEHLKSAI
jgi:hypothetical protein